MGPFSELQLLLLLLLLSVFQTFFENSNIPILVLLLGLTILLEDFINFFISLAGFPLNLVSLHGDQFIRLFLFLLPLPHLTLKSLEILLHPFFNVCLAPMQLLPKFIR